MIGIGLSFLKEIIQNDVWAEIHRRRMTELNDAVPDVDTLGTTVPSEF